MTPQQWLAGKEITQAQREAERKLDLGVPVWTITNGRWLSISCKECAPRGAQKGAE